MAGRCVITNWSFCESPSASAVNTTVSCNTPTRTPHDQEVTSGSVRVIPALSDNQMWAVGNTRKVSNMADFLSVNRLLVDDAEVVVTVS